MWSACLILLYSIDVKLLHYLVNSCQNKFGLFDQFTWQKKVMAVHRANKSTLMTNTTVPARVGNVAPDRQLNLQKLQIIAPMYRLDPCSKLFLLHVSNAGKPLEYHLKL